MFKVDTTTQFIHRLQIDSSLKLLYDFEKVPGKSTFSCNFAVLSETALMSGTPDRLVKEAHAGQAVYHGSRDSTATDAREKPLKKPGKADKEGKSGAGGQKRGKSALRNQNPPLSDKPVKAWKIH
jgi:hypothetical protein